MIDLVAFLDESRKPVRDRTTGRVAGPLEHYVVAAAVLFEGDLEEVRRRLRAVEAELGYRLHYADPRSRERQLAALTAVDRIAEWDALVFETARPIPIRNSSEHHVRAKLLTEAFTRLGVEMDVSRLVLETRASPVRGFHELDAKDHRVLQSLRTQGAVPDRMRMSHRDKSEPLLAVADLLAGARSDALCWSDRQAFSLLAHRVRSIVRVGPTP